MNQYHANGTVIANGMIQGGFTSGGDIDGPQAHTISPCPQNYAIGNCTNNVVFTTMDQIVVSSGGTGITRN